MCKRERGERGFVLKALLCPRWKKLLCFAYICLSLSLSPFSLSLQVSLSLSPSLSLSLSLCRLRENHLIKAQTPGPEGLGALEAARKVTGEDEREREGGVIEGEMGEGGLIYREGGKE